MHREIEQNIRNSGVLDLCSLHSWSSGGSLEGAKGQDAVSNLQRIVQRPCVVSHVLPDLCQRWSLVAVPYSPEEPGQLAGSADFGDKYTVSVLPCLLDTLVACTGSSGTPGRLVGDRKVAWAVGLSLFLYHNESPDSGCRQGWAFFFFYFFLFSYKRNKL